MPEISDLVKYAINYLSKYSSSKKNLERILKNKIRRTNIEKKEKFTLYVYYYFLNHFQVV